jgi:cytochrome c oxidase subunit 2
VGWGLFFVYALLRFRKGRQPVADHAGVKSKASTWLEVGVAVAEAVLLVGFSIPLWSARVDAFPARSEAVEVRVVGEQFAWNVHYPGPDGRFGKTDRAKIDVQSNPLGLDRSDPAGKDDVTTVNQLHLPVGKPVIVHLSSKDVIHSFALQEMRVKQDAVPGLSIPLWFVPTVTTEEMRRRKGQPEWNYEISCAQLCGLGHYRMRGFVTVETAEAYDKWIADQVAQLSPEGGDFWQ